MEKGVQLGAIELGLIAAVGLDQVQVVKQPLVAILSSGDEVRHVFAFLLLWLNNIFFVRS